MDKKNVQRARGSFSVLQTARQSQSAIMTLKPGEWSGEKGNEHPDSEQILLVLEGEVVAEIGDDKDVLHEGDSVVVPLRAKHRFGNRGQRKAVTFNVYAPPAY